MLYVFALLLGLLGVFSGSSLRLLWPTSVKRFLHCLDSKAVSRDLFTNVIAVNVGGMHGENFRASRRRNLLIIIFRFDGFRLGV